LSYPFGISLFSSRKRAAPPLFLNARRIRNYLLSRTLALACLLQEEREPCSRYNTKKSFFIHEQLDTAAVAVAVVVFERRGGPLRRFLFSRESVNERAAF